MTAKPVFLVVCDSYKSEHATKQAALNRIKHARSHCQEEHRLILRQWVDGAWVDTDITVDAAMQDVLDGLPPGLHQRQF